ncbi:MAG: hypothetical protein FJW96_15750 [Actinobacteria bacterium]|nr:hypothetical protein [Actinomycetota bacterium]
MKRRFLLVVVLLAAGAVAAILAAGSVAADTKPKPVVVPITVVKGKVQGGTRRPSVKKGALVRFVVRTDAGDEIHLHGYEIEKTPVRGKATVIEFRARIQGRFELELHHPDILLAELTVR